MNSHPGVRTGLVLSCGGLRGAAHLGVLRQLLRHGVKIDVIVGVSAGAIIAAYYAGVGLTVDEMIGDAPVFRGRHILMHGLMLRAHHTIQPYFRRFCGVIPKRLGELERAGFDTLHHGIRRIGIVCHDLLTNRPMYFSTGRDHGVRLAIATKASAAMPGALPPRDVTVDGRRHRLADGGISDSLPIAFARSAGLDATHIIVSDCRQKPTAVEGANLVYIRPDLAGITALRAPRATLMAAVRAGEAAITSRIVADIHAWNPLAPPAPASVAAGVVPAFELTGG